MDHADLRFHGNWRGRKVYRVMEDGRAIFMGTKGECRRFFRLHHEKCVRDSAEPVSPRRQKFLAKRYRVSPRRAMPA